MLKNTFVMVNKDKFYEVLSKMAPVTATLIDLMVSIYQCQSTFVIVSAERNSHVFVKLNYDFKEAGCSASSLRIRFLNSKSKLLLFTQSKYLFLHFNGPYNCLSQPYIILSLHNIGNKYLHFSCNKVFSQHIWFALL